MRMSDTISLLPYLWNHHWLHDCRSCVSLFLLLRVFLTTFVQCTRCTSSISATNRATNGHRFVFHSSEVIGTERHYIQDEPGVVPFDPPVFASPQPPVMPNPQNLAYPSPPFSPNPYYSQPFSQPRAASPPVARSDYLPTPPLEFANPVYNSPRHFTADLDASSVGIAITVAIHLGNLIFLFSFQTACSRSFSFFAFPTACHACPISLLSIIPSLTLA